MHVLGIDAGGTKTVCLLADADGRILAERRGGGANLQAVGELEVEKVLYGVMTATLAEYEGGSEDPPLRTELGAICLGIAGVDRPDDSRTIHAIMKRIGFKTPVVVVNDALVALVAGAGEGPGVVVVAGTGSIAYGRSAAGLAARAGGWGYLLGDEGGGFWIGRAALSAVLRQFDERGPATLLTELTLTQMQLASPGDLVHQVYYRDVHRHSIAALAAIVHQAAVAGDAVAAEILSRAGVELASAAASVIGRLNMRGEAFPIILAGGIFQGVPSLVGDVSARLLEAAPRSEIRRLEVEPAVGAVRLALAAARGGLTLPTYV